MRSLFLMAVLAFAQNASAMVTSCEYDENDRILIVAHSRGEKITQPLDYKDPENLGSRLQAKLRCDFVAISVNELRASSYRYLECNIRTNTGTNISHLTVEQPNAGRWVWSRGVSHVMRIDKAQEITPLLDVCEQVVRYSNTF